jgi:hypothetical protein
VGFFGWMFFGAFLLLYAAITNTSSYDLDVYSDAILCGWLSWLAMVVWTVRFIRSSKPEAVKQWPQGDIALYGAPVEPKFGASLSKSN